MVIFKYYLREGWAHPSVYDKPIESALFEFDSPDLLSSVRIKFENLSFLCRNQIAGIEMYIWSILKAQSYQKSGMQIKSDFVSHICSASSALTMNVTRAMVQLQIPRETTHCPTRDCLSPQYTSSMYNFLHCPLGKHRHTFQSPCLQGHCMAAPHTEARTPVRRTAAHTRVHRTGSLPHSAPSPHLAELLPRLQTCSSA